MEYIFYSVIGPHCKKPPSEIIKDKQKEIIPGICDFSLWSAKIDKKSVEQAWNLDPSCRVIVLCKTNARAKDPGRNEVTTAQKMIGPAGEETIPAEITTTYPTGTNYQAYKVKKYEILDSPKSFDLGKYETLLKNNTTKSFKERFKCTHFQNTFGKKNEHLNESVFKDITVIMELEYPFVVNIM